MPVAFNFIRSKREVLIAALLWTLFLVVPWGKIPTIQENLYLAFWTDMLRLGIAILLFIVPGMLLYLLLARDLVSIHYPLAIIPVGFAFSVLLIAVIGLIGRALGLSFIIVRAFFTLTGILEFVLLLLSKRSLAPYRVELRQSFRSLASNYSLIIALVLATSMTFHDSLFFIDDTTYSAYLTNWQYSTHLGFKNIIHEANVLEHVRFWLAMYPMGQALLSNLSGVPGLLLMGNYLELFLVPMAVITAYWFARVLGLSRRSAGIAALIQVVLYTLMIGDQWPVGTWFYQSLAEDKVSVVFLLAPVFFVMILDFIRNPAKDNLALVILSGIGIALTHPVMLFLSCAIGCGLSVFSWYTKKSSWREILVLLLVCMGLMIPYAVIRLSDRTGEVSGPYNGKDATTSFQIDRYTNVVSDLFYGLNPQVLEFFDIPLKGNAHFGFQVFRIIPIILASIAGIISLMRMKEGPLYWYVFTSVLLVFFATLPYTGWIIGYFVSARLISRASWFAPFGLAGVLTLKALRARLRTRGLFRRDMPLSSSRQFEIFQSLLVYGLFVLPMLVVITFPRIPRYFEKLSHNKQLAEMGTFIDQNSVAPVVSIALDYGDTQLLPAVSADTRLISFREELDYNGHNNFMSLDEIHQRIYASDAIRSLEQTVSPEEKCSLIQKYNVRFILSQAKDVELFEGTLAPCRSSIQTVDLTKDMVLLEINK